MKKLFSLLLVALFSAVLTAPTGCGDKDKKSETKKETTTTEKKTEESKTPDKK